MSEPSMKQQEMTSATEDVIIKEVNDKLASEERPQEDPA